MPPKFFVLVAIACFFFGIAAACRVAIIILGGY